MTVIELLGRLRQKYPELETTLSRLGRTYLRLGPYFNGRKLASHTEALDFLVLRTEVLSTEIPGWVYF